MSSDKRFNYNLFFLKIHLSIHSRNRPCKHDGPCDSRSNCACFENKAHCRNTCRCTKTCVYYCLFIVVSFFYISISIIPGLRRWKGCTCAKTGDVCGTKRCSCFKSNVECDPEVCLSCGTKYVIVFHSLFHRFVRLTKPHFLKKRGNRRLPVKITR